MLSLLRLLLYSLAMSDLVEQLCDAAENGKIDVVKEVLGKPGAKAIIDKADKYVSGDIFISHFSLALFFITSHLRLRLRLRLPSLFRLCSQCASSLCTPFNIAYSTRTHCRAITTLFNYYFGKGRGGVLFVLFVSSHFV